MAITYADVQEWFGLEEDSDGDYYPTNTSLTAFIASAENDFDADTEVTFDDSVTQHVKLIKMYLDLLIYNWYKVRGGNAEGYSTPAGSTNRQHKYTFYSEEGFNYLVKKIRVDNGIDNDHEESVEFYEGEYSN